MSKKKILENAPEVGDTPQIESKPRPLESLRDMLGFVSAGAGIFAALLYLAGRSFASGYFAAMNIPNYQVSFSLWEYGEVAWMPMIFYPILILGGSGLFWTVVYGIGDLIAPWLKRAVKIKRPAWFNPEFGKRTRQWFALFLLSILGMSLIWFADKILQFVKNSGEESGRIMVLEKAAQVELISSTPMPLDADNLLPELSSGQDYYVYQGFHLLTVNNDKYYLFKEIDSITCKPAKVYVIEARETLQVNLLPAVSLADQCKSANGQNINSVLATPTTNP
jgi:hypothetical protein